MASPVIASTAAGTPQLRLYLVDFVVARVMDQIGVPHTLMQRWGEGR